MPGLRDASTLLSPAVAETLSQLGLDDRDSAAAALAMHYAAVIDDSDNEYLAMRWVGPLLLDALESLGATPAARSRIKDGKPAQGAPRLSALRQARRA